MSEREVKAVTFTRRPDLKFYVRALTAIEDTDLYKRIRPIQTSSDGVISAEGVAQITSEQLAAFACTETGEALFADGAAALEFMRTHRAAIVAKLVKTGVDFQELDDEVAQEKTLKN